MSVTPNATETAGRELVLTRLIDAPRRKLFRARAESGLLRRASC